ncbi:MAG: ABC transporter substrate-binding protein [Hespellia sp.]|nr:ABC transporter substrate-binding protein [Hespellia sp.]
MKLKKLTAIVLAGAMTISLAACGGGDKSSGTATGSTGATATASFLQPNTDAANTEETDETLTIGLSSEPSTLFGIAAGKTENEDQIIRSALTETLVKKNYATGEIEPNLASEWEWVDGTHLKFTLRDDVTMGDGTPLVADDVVYTFNVCKEYCATSDVGKYLVGAVADDEHTVTIEFTTEAPDFLTMVSWTDYGIVTEDEVNAAGGLEAAQTNPVVGNGPYKFVEWKNGQSITLERNEDYWNTDYAGYYKTIVFTFTSDAAAREMAVESGDADVAVDMPVSQAATYASSDAVNTTIYSFGQETHLWYNMGDDSRATADANVRAAIDKALDFDAIAQVGTSGTADASLSYWDTSCEFYQANYTKEERDVDVDAAKELLAEAGYEDGLEITALGLQDNTPVLTVMQANLAEAGITLTIDTPDTAQFVEAAFGGDYDLICVGDTPATRIPPNVMPFLQTLNVEGPGMVIGGPKWTSDEFDSKITALITESDADKVVELATELDEMVKADTICSNLYPEMKAAVYAKDLKGYNTIERGFIDVTTLYK